MSDRRLSRGKRDVDGLEQDVIILYSKFEGMHPAASTGGDGQPPFITTGDFRKHSEFVQHPSLVIPAEFQDKWAGQFVANLDRAPFGLAAPWYIPLSEYDRWVELLGDDPEVIADHVRFGLRIEDVVAIVDSRAKGRSPRAMRVLSMAWRHTDLSVIGVDTPEDRAKAAMIISLCLRAVFRADKIRDRYTGGRLVHSVDSVVFIARIADYFSRTSGMNGELTDEVIEMLEISMTSISSMILGFLLYARPGCLPVSDDDMAERKYHYDSVSNISKRAAALALNKNISLQSKTKLMPFTSGPHIALMEIAPPRDPSKAPAGIPESLDIGVLDGISSIEDEAVAMILCQIMEAATKSKKGPMWPTTRLPDIVEMINDGVPIDWIISASFSETP